jgi:hypothetical protein
LNNSIEKIVEKKKPSEYDEKDIEAMMLAYVACSRAVKKLTSASLLDM